jgi:hypothetical protein
LGNAEERKQRKVRDGTRKRKPTKGGRRRLGMETGKESKEG